MIESENSAHEVVEFNHPFLQASFMFLGESLCMVVFLLTLAYKVLQTNAFCHVNQNGCYVKYRSSLGVVMYLTG